MKKIKIAGRILFEVVVFTILLAKAPVWLQWTAPVILSLLVEWYLAKRQEKRLLKAINSIDFTALQQHRSKI